MPASRNLLAAGLSVYFLRWPSAADGCRWCGFRQPGRVQYTDPAVKTHRSCIWVTQRTGDREAGQAALLGSVAHVIEHSPRHR
jgi:hypothetical protein